jgi:hypothetical protein
MRLFCVELTERKSAIIWAEDEQAASKASARLPQDKWRLIFGPEEVTEMDPGSIYPDEQAFEARDLRPAARDGADGAADEWPRRYRLDGITPVPLGASASEQAEWERWRETADRTVAESHVGVADVEVTVDTLFRAALDPDDFNEEGMALHFVTTVYPTHRHASDLLDGVAERFSIDTAMARRIPVVQQLFGAPAEDEGDWVISLGDLELGAPTWQDAEQHHQLVVEVILAVMQDRGVAVPGGVQTTWTRAARR